MSLIAKAAPGKLMIAGEYSVLFSGRALVAAMDRFAHASYSPAATFSCWTCMGNQWHRDDHHPLWLAIIKVARAHNLEPPVGLYKIDSSSFFTGEHQFGLGSSAAATVALVKVIAEHHKVDNLQLLHQIAQKAHREFSQGLGSGADIAASFFGCALLFCNTQKGPQVHQVDLSWLGLELTVVFTKQAQDTRSFVKDAIAFAQKDPKFIAYFVAQSNSLVQALLTKPDLAMTIALWNRLSQLLRAFGKESHIGIMSKAHEDLHELALSLGGSAKPSGAGGGDSSLVLVPRQERDRLAEGVKDLGLEIVPLALAQHSGSSL